MPRNIIHSRQRDLLMSRKNKMKSNNLVMAVSKLSTVSTASAGAANSGRWTNMIQNCQRQGGCRGCSFR
jgi:hypothetical protein